MSDLTHGKKRQMMEVSQVMAQELEQVAQLVRGCIQCGTCSGSCPNEFAMDFTPRRMWRMVLMGYGPEVFASRTFGLCSSCYTCTLRCPRGLPLTDAMAALKRIAHRHEVPAYNIGRIFYQNFLDNIRKFGRVREMALMTHYFARMKNPMLPLRFAPLGLALMRRGKILNRISSNDPGGLEKLFERVEKLEGI